jgi:hypothetical protein
VASALPIIDVIMKNAAAFILLLTVGGTPVTTLACVGWCTPDATPVASCPHHGSGAGASVMDANDTCARLLTASPFLREETQQTRTALPASAPYALSDARGEALLVSVHDVAGAPSHRAASPLVLRL